jgi:hypothetical protein
MIRDDRELMHPNTHLDRTIAQELLLSVLACAMRRGGKS